MALFPQFPYSNLHELNLDWLIEQIRQIEGKGVVLSVNGLSGVVTLYTDKDVVFPDLGLEDNWQIYRLINDKVAGLKFTGEKFFYITKNVDDEEFTVHEVYTSNNPPPYPVVSVNGEDGAVRLAGDTLPYQIDGSMTIEDVITPLEESIGPVIRYNKCNKGVSAGQYVYLIGSGIVGRTDGLYKAVNSVSANTVWTAADLQIMPNGLGGLVAANDTAISALNSNKANYLLIDATSYTHNSKSGWDFVYGKIPDGYNGILKINFDSGYNIVCTAFRQNSNWGSIIGHENSNHNPFFYYVQAGTSTLDELAPGSKAILKSEIVNISSVTTNNGYADLINYRPNHNIVMAGIRTWSSIDPVACLTLMTDGHYLIASESQVTITALQIEYFYFE